MQVVILAGGMGTRLRTVTGDDLPKPLVEINGRPLLDYHLAQIAQAGIREVVLLTGFGGDRISAFCGNGSKWGLNLRCVQEAAAAGTAGAVLQALDALQERFLVLYGDTVFDFDMDRMWAFHENHSPDATVFLHPNDHPHDSDLVEVNDDDFVLNFHPYPHPPDANLPNLVNAGIYILERKALAGLTGLPAKPDFGKHVFPLMLAQGRRLAGYRSPEYVKDAGTPERLKKTAQDLLSGRVAGCSLRHPAPAVFLDRDGTLNVLRDYLMRPDQMELIPGAGAALARLNQSQYRTALITNQPVVARGDCDEEGMRQIHNRLETLLGAEGAYLDSLYHCPHHPDAGFPGERVDLKIVCDCRKPGIGLIQRAQQELNIDLAQSWMIGDTTTDVMTARNAGVRSILVHTGEAGRDGKFPYLPDFECPSVVEAIDLILRLWPRAHTRAAEIAKGIAPSSIVLVGGQARSGKSTFSASLAAVLQKQGLAAIVVPLDCWLLGEKDNRGPSVLERFDLPSARAFLVDALVVPGSRKVPHYDRMQRKSIPGGVTMDVPPNPVLIVEGVVALADAELRAMASRSIYVERDEADRIREVTANYRWRGWDEDRIATLLADRAAEELPLVEGSSKYADVIVKDLDHDCL
jgi:histidinol-phosphate phosphatase family protein